MDGSGHAKDLVGLIMGHYTITGQASIDPHAPPRKCPLCGREFRPDLWDVVYVPKTGKQKYRVWCSACEQNGVGKGNDRHLNQSVPSSYIRKLDYVCQEIHRARRLLDPLSARPARKRD